MSVDDLAAELLSVLIENDPVAATLRGTVSSDPRLPDLSLDAEESRTDRLRAILDAARAERRVHSGTTGLPLTGSSRALDELTQAVILHEAESALAQLRARAVEYTVSFPLTAPAQYLLHSLPMLRPRTDTESLDFLEQLAAVPTYLDAAAERLRLGTATGRRASARLARSAVNALDAYLGHPSTDPFLRPRIPRRLASRRDRLLTDAVRPAFGRYRDVVNREVVSSGRPSTKPGVCWLPDGDAVYSGLCRSHTTTTHAPEELHEIGLGIIESLRDEYAEVGYRAFGVADVRQIFERMRSDPGLRWADADQALNTARTAVARAAEAAPNWFACLPDETCQVAPVPDEEAARVTAYYVMGTRDRSRLGTYYVNTYRVSERDLFTSEVYAFHEAVPGHHLQLTLARDAQHLHPLRRHALITAYVEGWALYAERLADRMGLYSDDVMRLGMLSEDSLRAARLVVDTGLHAHGWSTRQAEEFLRDNTLLPNVDIRAEVDRYIEWPGQALSYMVGRLELDRMRETALTVLGSRFGLSAFHDLVLRNGPLPLPTLRTLVHQWARQQAADPP